MKRLLRIFRRTLLALSLLIFLGALFLWHRSLHYWDFYSLYIGRQHIFVNTYPDALRLTWGSRTGPWAGVAWKHHPQQHPPGSKVVNREYRWGLRMIGLGRYRWNEHPQQPLLGPPIAYSGYELETPFWLIAVITFLPSLLFVATRLRRFLKRRRLRSRGLCPACGYDLRATPDHCPECGQKSGSTSLAGNSPISDFHT